MLQLKVKKLCEQAKLPTRVHSTDCGLDLYALDDMKFMPHEAVVISTGIAVSIDNNHVGMICDRSSMAKKGVSVQGGIIDPGYTGEIRVVLANVGNSMRTICQGDKIAQLLIIPISTPEVIEVTNLDVSERGEKGFGSSGV